MRRECKMSEESIVYVINLKSDNLCESTKVALKKKRQRSKQLYRGLVEI
jgi:hypothetical protein